MRASPIGAAPFRLPLASSHVRLASRAAPGAANFAILGLGGPGQAASLVRAALVRAVAAIRRRWVAGRQPL